MAAVPNATKLTIAALMRILEPLEEVCESSVGVFGRPVMIAQKSPRQIDVTKVPKNYKESANFFVIS